MPFIETYDQRGTSWTNAAVGANVVYLVRFRVAAPVTVSTVTIYVNAALGNIDIGFYSSSDGGTNYSLLTRTGSTVCAGVNALQAIALLAPITVVPGLDYWWAFGSDSTPTIARGGAINNVAALVNFQLANKGSAWSSGLPATIASPTGTTLLPWIHGA